MGMLLTDEGSGGAGCWLLIDKRRDFGAISRVS